MGVQAWLKERLGRVDPELLVGALLLVALVWGFVGIADLAGGPEAPSMDTQILLSLRSAADPSDPVGPVWVEEMVRDFTSFGSASITTLVTLIVVAYLLLLGRPRSALFVVVAVVGGVLLGILLKGFFDRARPDVVPHLVEVLSKSFPSGHSMMAAVVYPTLGAMLARVSSHVRVRIFVLLVAILLAFAVGFSRVYLGVHYPTDVLGGWTVGFSWALVCYLTVRALQHRRKVEPAPATKPAETAEEMAEPEGDTELRAAE